MSREQLQEQLAQEVQTLTPAQLKATAAYIRYLSWAQEHGISTAEHTDRIMQLTRECAKTQDFSDLIKFIESLYLPAEREAIA